MVASPNPWKKPKNSTAALRVRLEAERVETAEVLERLVDHRQADHRVHQIGVDVPSAEHAEQQRAAVPDREQCDVQRDVLEPERKKITPARNNR